MHSPPVSVGWEFNLVNRDDKNPRPIHFSTTGDYTFDLSRDVVRAIGGLVLLPDDRSKVNLSSDWVEPYIVLDGVRYQMGRFVFSEDVEQRNVVLDENGTTANLTNVALADQTTMLLRNDGRPETLYAGFRPTFEMERMVFDSKYLNTSIEADDSANTETISWDGTTSVLSKVRQLAELAGHMTPWLDNFGTLRSVSANRIYGTVLKLDEDLFLGDSDSVSVTNNYLTIPNRVIVTSTSSDSQIVGVWDAPASWPSSAAQRGYIQATTEQVQGLHSSADAEKVAASIGRRLSARKLSFRAIPTYVLDGPRVLSYDDALWTVTSWSMSTSPGSQMSVEAEEYFAEDDDVIRAPRELPGML
jgi:hypothetical protein